MDQIKLPAQLGAYCKLDILDCNKRYICCCAIEEDADQIVAALNAQQQSKPKADNVGFRTCQYCGCYTNAKLRACCNRGHTEDAQQPCQPSGMNAEELNDWVNDLLRWHKQAAARIEELEKEREEYLKELLLCPCGWIGSVEDQDALGTKCGCCPHCGNENLVFASDAIKRIDALEKACSAALIVFDELGEDPDGYATHAIKRTLTAALGEEGENG